MKIIKLAKLYPLRSFFLIYVYFFIDLIFKKSKHITDLISQINSDDKFEGSSTKLGWLYHDYPLPDEMLNIHRRKTINRLLFLKKYLTFKDKKIIDLGCSSGGISIGCSLLGAKQVHGYDHDHWMLSVGRLMVKKYHINNVSLINTDISKADLVCADIVLWLSQWMWIVKQHGMNNAREKIFKFMKETGCKTLVFESAADDGKAAIPGFTQENVYQTLVEWSGFNAVEDIGPFPDDWSPGAKRRNVYICSDFNDSWVGKKSKIERLGANRVRKTYLPERIWAKNNEVDALKRLLGNDHFPQLIASGDNWFEMSWCGSSKFVPNSISQLDEIVGFLEKTNILHRDICPNNLMSLDGTLILIDFEWAIIDGLDPAGYTPPGLGRGYYDVDHFSDRAAADKVAKFFTCHHV